MKKIVVVNEKYLAIIWPYSDTSAEVLHGSGLRGASIQWGSIPINKGDIVRPALSEDFKIFGVVETGYDTDPEIEYDKTRKLGIVQKRLWWRSLVPSQKKILIERYQLTEHKEVENPQPSDSQIEMMWANDPLIKLNYDGSNV
jgi:hypothetical protein